MPEFSTNKHNQQQKDVDQEREKRVKKAWELFDATDCVGRAFKVSF